MRWIALTLAVGCQGTALPAESLLDRQRILAVRFEAGDDARSEGVPGDLVRATALAWAPEGPPTVLYAPCVPTAPGDPAAVDPSAPCPSDELVSGAKDQDFASADGAAWARSNGVAGVEPELPPAVPVSAQMLAGRDRLYLPIGLEAWVDDPDEPDERARVSLVMGDGSAPDPNHDPDPPFVAVDGAAPSDGGALELRGGKHRLAIADPPVPETWTDDSGEHVEVLSYRWYSDLGDLTDTELVPPGPGLPEPDRTRMDWELPAGKRDGVLFVVVRDGRGGMAWSSFAVRVR